MNKETERIYEAIETVCTIYCSSCGEEGNDYEIDAFEAADDFQAKGWRATIHGNVYCPRCAKKKLKK